jgi:hypothetical protein
MYYSEFLAKNFMANDYVPGVCNIGPAEVRLRKLFGSIGLILTFVTWAAFVLLHVPAVWRLTLFFPAMFAAVGYLQAAWHFCAKFGLGGVFNFGPHVGKTDSIEQAEYRRQDRRTALQIIGLSLLVATIVAAAAYFVPL